MDKVYKVIIAIFLVVFSFFYTEKVIYFIRERDPIMKNIKKSEKDYKIDPINATIKDNKIVPGVNGKTIDYDNSYKKMKKYGTYNESLTVFKEELPTISIDDYYDKYISQGSGINNDVSLVFEVKKNDNITNILSILKENNATATFFIDGLFLENNNSLVTSMAEEGYEIEILNYDNKYDELYFSSSLNTLNTITNLKPKYCFAKYDSKEVLELCSKLELHTIIPTIMTGNYPYKDVKAKLSKGSIIGFSINSSTEIELSTVINYIKQKGYVINTLDSLLSEALNLK